MVSKTCKKCGGEFPLSGFNKNKLTKDGLRADCKACQKSYNKSHRESKLEYYKAYDKWRFYHCEKRRSYCYNTSKASREKYPEKYKARVAVSNALRDGRLVKPQACQWCGKEGPLEGHHHSYEKAFWLDVVWLCKGCHTEAHRQGGDLSYH